MKETQYQKIKEIHADGDWHCNNEYRARFIFSPHKRREEMSKIGYHFQWRPCEHGYQNVRDYKMISTEKLRVIGMIDLPTAYKPKIESKQIDLL